MMASQGNCILSAVIAFASVLGVWPTEVIAGDNAKEPAGIPCLYEEVKGTTLEIGVAGTDIKYRVEEARLELVLPDQIQKRLVELAGASSKAKQANVSLLAKGIRLDMTGFTASETHPGIVGYSKTNQASAELKVIANKSLETSSYVSLLLTFTLPNAKVAQIKCDAVVLKVGEAVYGEEKIKRDKRRALVTWYGPVVVEGTNRKE